MMNNRNFIKNNNKETVSSKQTKENHNFNLMMTYPNIVNNMMTMRILDHMKMMMI